MSTTKTNIRPLEVGDHIWVTPAEDPTPIELQVAEKLAELFPNSATNICLAVHSINSSCAVGAEPKDALKVGDAFAFVIHTDEVSKVKFPRPHLIWASEPGKGFMIQFSMEEINLTDKNLLVLAKPFSGNAKVETPTNVLGVELGLIYSLFAFGLSSRPLFTGSFTMKFKKFTDYSTRLRGQHSRETKTVVYSSLAQGEFHLDELDEKRKRALMLCTRAFQTRDGPAKSVYYRAAIEQLFGKSSQNTVRTFYSKRKKTLGDVAYQVVNRIETIRNKVLHNGIIDELSGHDERLLLAIIHDKLCYEDKADVLSCSLRHVV